jgi:lactate dehydrogenase-like 2-hydroxyacid dehydrogenase
MSISHVLMTNRMMPLIEDRLRERFTVHMLPPDSELAAFFAAHGPQIGGVATGGAHRRVGAELFAGLPNLKIVSNFGVGYDTVDAAEAGRRGIVVTNTPDVLNEEVADTALGLLIATVRELPQADRYVRAGKWTERPYRLTPGTLRGRTVGIVGMGRIGQAIARRIEGFGLAVVYHSRNKQAGVAYRHYPKLLDMARDVDTLIVIVPGGPATKNMIDAEVLAALGPQGVLINIARGSVVDEPALIEALEKRTIMAAGLDVFAAEPHVPPALLAMEHVVLLPHVGSASEHTRQAMGQLVVDNLVAWASGKPPLTPVPETPFKGW